MTRGKTIFIALAGALAVAVTATALMLGLDRPFQPAERAQGAALVGGPFTLVDQNGKRRGDAEFRGKLMLVMFGYSNCPDVCPISLQIISQALDMLGAEAAKVQPIMITIDPERDTQERLKEYAANFHPSLVALTGTKEALTEAIKGYRVYAAKAKAEPAHDHGDAQASNYLMDHSSVIYLMGRDGQYLAHFTHTTNAEALAAALRAHL